MVDRAEQILNNIIAVVKNWMEYMQLIVRTPKLLNEHSMCIPISEYLERNSEVEFELEKKHKELAKKRVDIYWSCDQKEYYLELKLSSGYSSDTLSDYYDDLCRLSLLNAQNARCFFLLSGKTDDFYTAFYDTQRERIRQRKICEWLSLDSITTADSIRTIYTLVGLRSNIINKKSGGSIDCFDAFLSEYGQAYATLHNNTNLANAIQPFRTKLLYYNNLKKRKKSNNSIAIWEVLPIQPQQNEH